MQEAPGNLIDLLLKNTVFHRDSVVLYKDNSWSIGNINKKPVAGIYPIELFEGQATGFKKHLQQRNVSWLGSMSMTLGIQNELRMRRGEKAFHYDNAEKEMLRDAANIAAREPETIALMAEHPPLRIVVCPEPNIDLGICEELGRGFMGMSTPSNVVIVAHPIDTTTDKYVTLHELVHCAGDTLWPGKIRNIVHERIPFYSTLLDTWKHNPDALTPPQDDFIVQWQEKLAALPDHHAMPPYDPQFGMDVLASITKSMRPLIRLRKEYTASINDLEWTNEMGEFVPYYEQELGKLGANRLDADDPAHKLMKFAFPELGEFVEKDYLPRIRDNYTAGLKVLQKDKVALEIAPLVRPIQIKLAGREEKDRGLSTDERAIMKKLRLELKHTLCVEANHGVRPLDQQRQDELLDKLQEFYSKHGATTAETMALEEFSAVRSAIQALKGKTISH